MSPMTTATEKALLGYELGDTAPTIPGTHYCALISAMSRQNSSPYSVGQYIVNPFAFPFGGTGTTVWSLFKCTAQTGNSAASQPSAFGTSGGAGGTITDGLVTWTEVSTLFAAGTFTGAEPSGNGYARVQITNNTTNWPAPSGGDPAQVQNGTQITFPATTASWGQIAGVVLFDALTSGNARWWGCLNSASEVATVVGVTPDFAVDGLTFTLL